MLGSVNERVRWRGKRSIAEGNGEERKVASGVGTGGERYWECLWKGERDADGMGGEKGRRGKERKSRRGKEGMNREKNDGRREAGGKGGR